MARKKRGSTNTTNDASSASGAASNKESDRSSRSTTAAAEQNKATLEQNAQATSSESATSTTGSSSSSSSSGSSESSSSSSDSSSSSETDNSSAVSTRSRAASRGHSTDGETPQKSTVQQSQDTLNQREKQNVTQNTNSVKTRASSESDQETSVSNKRGPKTSATSVPKGGTSGSHRKNIPKTTARVPQQVANNQKTPTKGHHHNSSATSQTKKSQNKKSSSITNSVTPEKKLSSKKKSSLFSPANSSESEVEENHKTKIVSGGVTSVDIRTSSRVTSRKIQKSPNKPTLPSPVKSTSRHTNKTQRQNSSRQKDSLSSSLTSNTSQKDSQRKTSRKVSEKSSESSTNSSSSSESDSDSSSDSSGSAKSSQEKSVTGTSIYRKSSKVDGGASTESDKEEEDDDEGRETPRKHVTRSTSVRTKRSSLLGMQKGTDSDSENGASKNNRGSRANIVKKQRSTSPSKVRAKVSPKSKCPTKIATKIPGKSGARCKTKKRIPQDMLEKTPLPPIEKRKCPVDQCDSTGHLGGQFERHFTVGACPVYHNLSKEECKENRSARVKEMEERERLRASMGNKSPRNGPTTEQRNYCYKIRDSRDKLSEIRPGEEEMADSDRQPSLRGLTPDWDLQIFLQAQSMASEKVEDDLRGLPDSKGIKFIQMGRYEMEAWYHSQYPDDYNQQPKIYICEFCLKYMRSKTILGRHAAKCVWRHPPGDEIYRKDKLSVWEVDGSKYKTYCQNLCLLAMLFLDHKTLYYDVEPFLFYIMTQGDNEGCHIIGYFSKEKNSFLNYNVSCIMTLPPFQRQGYGRLLIDFSYLLTRVEGKHGSPEKPLSDLGLISYRSYWKDLLLKYLSTYKPKNVCIKDIGNEMAVSTYDIVSTFQWMGMMKYWKGKHILLKRRDLLEDYLMRLKRRHPGHKDIDPDCLNWRPYVPPATTEEPPERNKAVVEKKVNT